MPSSRSTLCLGYALATAVVLSLWLAGCGGKPAGESCQLTQAHECASGGCVTVTCPDGSDRAVCTGESCADAPCGADAVCLETAGGGKRCFPNSSCR
jgi:hypothetical protein